MSYSRSFFPGVNILLHVSCTFTGSISGCGFFCRPMAVCASQCEIVGITSQETLVTRTLLQSFLLQAQVLSHVKEAQSPVRQNEYQFLRGFHAQGKFLNLL